MADVQAGKRYAQAVFAIAQENGSLGQWRQDIEDIAIVLAESELSGRFADARTPVEGRQALAERVLDIQPQAMNLAKLLIAKGRSADARAVADAFTRMANVAESIVNATVTTAVPLSEAEVADLERKLGQQLSATVHITTAIDPSIVGGIIVRVGDRIVDGSIRTRLRELRRELVSAR